MSIDRTSDEQALRDEAARKLRAGRRMTAEARRLADRAESRRQRREAARCGWVFPAPIALGRPPSPSTEQRQPLA